MENSEKDIISVFSSFTMYWSLLDDIYEMVLKGEKM